MVKYFALQSDSNAAVAQLNACLQKQRPAFRRTNLRAVFLIIPFLFRNSEASEWTVYAGETDQDLMPVNGQASFVTDVIMHESYDEDTYENDIAMMRLKSPLKMNDKVKTICLPTADHALEPNDM